MFLRSRDPPPCIRESLSLLLHGLQMGAMQTPNRATQTCPPTSALFAHPSNEQKPRVLPVARSASFSQLPLLALASELPSTFHACTGSRMRNVVAIEARVSRRAK